MTVRVWAGIAASAAAATALGFYLVAVGLDKADKIASALGLFVALAGLLCAIVGLRADRRSGSSGEPSPGGETRRIEQVADASGQAKIYQAGGDQRIVER